MHVTDINNLTDNNLKDNNLTDSNLTDKKNKLIIDNSNYE